MNILTTIRRAAIVTALLATIAPAASAQQDVMRDAFGFYGSRLDVLVEAETPGRIRFVRGSRSRIEVAGRAPNGFATAALGGHGVRRLTLTSMGGERVDFVVVVPEDVRVRLYRPGSRRSELFGSLAETASYAWGVAEARPSFETIRPRRDPSVAPVTTTPRTLEIRGAALVDYVTLRVRGDRFDVSPGSGIARRGESGPMTYDASAGDVVRIDVPAGSDFTLRFDGVDAAIVENGAVRTLCRAAMMQRLPDDSQWLTLTPSEGCAGRSEPPAGAARRT